MQEIYLSLASMSGDEGERLDENSKCTFSEEKIRDLPGFYRFRICTNCLLASLHAVNVCSRRASYLHIKLDAMVSGMTEPVALPRFY